eukprot:TRINITY_DN21644_c0_g1_i1.p1 TRINITY_DN21644_c0_g1~~TRINITY_DN21644_c0_g1_i1.p1  ORF type:complete len:167 (+),score=45.89 TRINITY_DN21644_c0_g1_i1:217-717(+)
MLSEQKIVISSPDTALLTPLMEAARALLFPFHWVHTFIPFLPPLIDLADFVQSPCPFFVGVHASVANTIPEDADVVQICIRKPETIIKLPNGASSVPWLLPSSLSRPLMNSLSRMASKLYNPSEAFEKFQNARYHLKSLVLTGDSPRQPLLQDNKQTKWSKFKEVS